MEEGQRGPSERWPLEITEEGVRSARGDAHTKIKSRCPRVSINTPRRCDLTLVTIRPCITALVGEWSVAFHAKDPLRRGVAL